MIKRTSIITMLICSFLFLGTGTAGADMRYIPEGLDYYGIKSWTGVSPTPLYEYWDSGQFVDPEPAELGDPMDEDDWVYSAAIYDSSWWGWDVSYEFHLENVERPDMVKSVYFYAEWTASQGNFAYDPGWLVTEIYDYPNLNGEEIVKNLLDIDGNGEIDAIYLEYLIEPQPRHEFITIYNWSWEDAGEGGPWHIEYAEMGTKCVPIPGAVYLLGSGLLGLIGIQRRRLKAEG